MIFARFILADGRTLTYTGAPTVTIAPLPKPDTATVIAAIADGVGSSRRIFTVAELQRKAEDDESLRAALTGLSAKQIGKLLHRNIGVDSNGYRIERMGAERDGALWRVVGS